LTQVNGNEEEENGSGSEGTETTTEADDAPFEYDDPAVIRCRELERKMIKPFTACCPIPTLAINHDDYEACLELETENGTTLDDDIRFCLSASCFYKKMGMIMFNIDPFIRPDFHAEGMIQSLLYSMRKREMDGTWEPIARRAVNRCFDDFEGAVEGFYCNETIPNMLNEVAYCNYKELFLSCPEYSKRYKRCSYNLEYMRECWFEKERSYVRVVGMK
jgi:hypothetical protein